MSRVYSFIILHVLIIIAVDSLQQRSCVRDDTGCAEDGGLWSGSDSDLTGDYPSITSLLTADYQLPDHFFTEICKAMENKRGDPGLPRSWWSNDVTLMQRMCKDETASGLDKLVPCANDESVRQSILKSVADNTDIPPPRADVTAEEAQRYVCRISKSCLQACLKTMRSSCDPKGVWTAVGVLRDLLQSPGDYKIPLLDLGHSCLTELLLLL